ncbi:MAG: type III pantothenate kinase [Saprospiraceae bacterium]|nr:type III pantothenate kinase [Saprospiraceae bacterium]MCB9322918.1 type III pantothenate kinase [Lewinellaceae bacterium]
MLLVIDIGNSNVCLGLWQEDQWRNIWRLPTFQNDLEVYYETQLVNRFLEANVQLMEVTRVVMSSVVPDMNHRMLISLEKLFGMGVILVGPEIYPKIDLQIDNPSEIGTDLVANAVAAYHQFGRDCIIVDFGTALTFTTLTKEGQILGVSIVPGLKTAIKALFTKTAQLPEVPMEHPVSALGKNTVQAIQSGIFYGYTGLVINMVESIRKEVGEHYEAIATGGLSTTIKSLEEYFLAIEPNLTLNGLRYIAQEISDRKKDKT